MANSVSISGTGSARDRIRDISRRARTLEAAKPDITRTLERHVAETFETRGTSAGKSWTPLSNPYARRKKARTSGGPLILSGSLMASFTGGKWHVEQSSPNSISWGSKHPLAHLHQKGTPGRRVPARPMLIVTERLKKKVLDDVRSHVLGTQ